MFLHQKFNYEVTFIETIKGMQEFLRAYHAAKPTIMAWDTETTGLDFMIDTPFLLGVGFGKKIYIFEPKKEFIQLLYMGLSFNYVKYFIAHNAKYDYHMMINNGTPVPKGVPVADLLALARITEYADSRDSNRLEDLGKRMVDDNSKFAGEVIKTLISNMYRQKTMAEVKKYVATLPKEITYKALMDAYNNERVQYIAHKWEKHFLWIDKNARKPNYEDAYKENPNLMINYLADDIVLVLEITSQLLPVLDVVDEEHRIFKQENDLIPVTARMERVGMRVDVEYLLESRAKVLDIITKKYKELYDLTGVEFSVGQHAFIKKYMRETHGIVMESTDISTFETLIKRNYSDVINRIARTILDLRGLEKLKTTYIDGKLNRLINGRIYTEIKNYGTVTGRASSDMQQQSKEGYVVDGVEIFHPRKIFISDDGYTNYYIDFNNMEMRVQAYYTMLVSEGDFNLCRAFIPFKCTNILTGEEYDPVKHFDEWNSGMWVDENGNPWKKTDLHTATTLKAFPNLTGQEEDFDMYRQLGKRVNFAKNYGAAKRKIQESLDLDEETAEMLNRGYYEAFPKIRDYQRWVQKEISMYGYCSNLFGRRYYIEDPNNTYKVFNYLVQGSCADFVKRKEIEIDALLEGTNSHMVLPIHDEIVFSIKHGEEYLVPKIRAILEDSRDYFKTIPMECTVAIGNPSWADKVDL